MFGNNLIDWGICVAKKRTHKFAKFVISINSASSFDYDTQIYYCLIQFYVGLDFNWQWWMLTAGIKLCGWYTCASKTNNIKRGKNELKWTKKKQKIWRGGKWRRRKAFRGFLIKSTFSSNFLIRNAVKWENFILRVEIATKTPPANRPLNNLNLYFGFILNKYFLLFRVVFV